MAGGRFQPGKSGNPGGRPKALGWSREMARAHTEEAINAAVGIMRKARSPAMARLKAIELILDRGWGKPVSATAIATMDHSSPRHLSSGELVDALIESFGGPEQLDRYLCAAIDEADDRFDFHQRRFCC